VYGYHNSLMATLNCQVLETWKRKQTCGQITSNKLQAATLGELVLATQAYGTLTNSAGTWDAIPEERRDF